MKTEMNQELISHFIEQLESLGLEIGSKLDKIEQEKQDYHFFKELLERLEESKTEFCSSYFALEEDAKKSFQNRLLNLFKDQEIVDNIMQEIINLYYLQEYGLLDLDETAPQKEVALENLETLSTKITKYLQDTNIEQLEKDDERLSDRLDKIVSLGTIIESDEATPIEDISFLREIMELIPDEESVKRSILMEIIHHNLKVYKNHYEKKKENIPVVEPIVIEELNDNPKVTSDLLRQIDELLSKKEIVERIAKVIQNEFTTTIHIHSLSEEEYDEVKSSVDMAKEDIISRMEGDKTLTPEEALVAFFRDYDETVRHKKEFLERLLEGGEESSLSQKDREQLMSLAFSYLDSKRKLLGDLTEADKKKIRNYMTSLFQEEENRKMMYEGPMYSDYEKEQMAAYEIEVYKELLEVVPENDLETRSKIAKKIENIFRYLPEEKQEVEEPDKPHLFFLMGDNESLFEEDLALESNGKGISSKYFSELKNQLSSILDRSNRTLVSSQPVNPGLKAMKKQGVKYTTGARTKVFFIPVGKQDAIVLGTSFLTGKDILKDIDRRTKKYESEIEQIKSSAQSKEAQEESDTVMERIFSSLSPKELDEMFKEEDKEEKAKKL